MFKFFLFLRNKLFSSFRFSLISLVCRYWLTLYVFLKNFIFYPFKPLKLFFSLIFTPRFLTIYVDFYEVLKYRIAYVWLLVIKHRLFYILRLSFIIFLLYKPVLMDLDSVYWLSGTIFYFFSNNFFFFLSAMLPGSIGFKSWWFYKIFVVLSFFPAFWSARRLKKRLLKRRRWLLGDDDIVLVFTWVQQFFIYTAYYLIFFFLFFLFSFLLPIIYIYLSEIDFIFISRLFLTIYLSSHSFIFLPFYYLFSFTSLSILPLFYNFIFLQFYFLTNWLTIYTFMFTKIGLSCVSYLLFGVLPYLLAVFFNYTSIIYNAFIIFLSFVNLFYQNFDSFYSFKHFDNIIEVFKNFLFSDNYINFISMILINIFKTIFSFLYTFLSGILVSLADFVFGVWLLDALANIVNSFTQPIVFLLYDILIFTLEKFTHLYNLYFSEISVFGLFSTWYEYLNNNVQKGDTKNSLINWLLLHVYLSIIVFWFLDFDFRVSAKSPPKTPYTLLEEAKKTYDWVPAEMDFGSMQTDHTSVYFALLDISFEHVESLHFVYGDFEYVDEEWDHEDDTPDEDEIFNDVQETVNVRDTIDSDIYYGKKVKLSRVNFNPLNAKTSYERHYLTEIVGEPELTFIEPELKWMYASIYSPSFEELHFKDSLFSEWVFDPDEDLTLFEVLIFFPLFFYFIYVWFYHRRKRKHYKAWLRYMIPTKRTAYSGSYIEDLFGVRLGDFGKRIFDTMRKYKSPELKVKNFYRLKLQRNNQRLKLLQVESFFFEKTRHNAYKKAFKEWEKGLDISVKFLVPRKHSTQFRIGIRNLKIEMKTWIKLGDWMKFDRFCGEYKYKAGFQKYDWYQYDLPTLLDRYMMKVARIRKRKRYLWRTINKLPGHNLTARRAKFWHSRFSNTEFFFPSYKMKYNYNYYNYIGWRENRTQWRRYAFTPGNVTNKIWALNRDVPEGGYRSFRVHQKKKRLMKSFQF